MVKLMIAGFLLLVMCSSVPAGAVGKLAADPNVGRAKAADEMQLNGDVGQKVTYEAKRKTVSSILADLSQMTGVTLKAGYNNNDWQVRDRRMNIFVKDIPLSNLMNSIARVMKFTWSKKENEDGVVSYRLYMDRRTLIDAETQSLRDKERREKQMAENRQRLLEDFGNLGNLSEQDLAKLRTDNPYLYSMAITGIGTAFGEFFKEMPVASEAMASGQRLSIAAGTLPAQTQQMLLKALQGFLIPGFNDPESEAELQEMVDNINQVSVMINQNYGENPSDPFDQLVVGDIALCYNDHQCKMDVFNPESKVAKVFGDVLAKIHDGQMTPEQIMQEAKVALTEALSADMTQEEPEEKPDEQPDDPELERKIKLEVKGKTLVDHEEAFSKAAQMSVVSDSFGNEEIMTKLARMPQGEVEIRKVLDTIRDGYFYKWEKHGSTIEFRDRNWYRKRAAQIPESWLEKWRETLKNTGTLDLLELAQIAMLTTEQYNVNIVGDEVLAGSGFSNIISRNRDILRFYASLDNGQRTMIFSETGLPLESLRSEQWPEIQNFITRKNGVMLQNSKAQLILKGSRKPLEKVYDYAFSVSSTDDVKPLEFTITTPKYVEPKKEQ